MSIQWLTNPVSNATAAIEEVFAILKQANNEATVQECSARMEFIQRTIAIQETAKLGDDLRQRLQQIEWTIGSNGSQIAPQSASKPQQNPPPAEPPVEEDDDQTV